MASIVFKDGLDTILPQELVDSLNQAYFLHVLATDPEKVIPPGKSLLSMLLHSQLSSGKESKDDAQPLLERVKEVAHRAFWDEAAEALSSPEPAIQLPRLRRLYGDLADALEPLFPPGHRAIVTLRSHLAPTTSPLHSTLVIFKEVLVSLKERCAPVRDDDINGIYQELDEWNDNAPPPLLSPSHSNSQSGPSVPSALATLIVEGAKKLIHLTELMKSDLNTAVLGSMSDIQIKSMIFQKAKEKERQFVLQRWTTEAEPGGQVLRDKWRSWLAELAGSAITAYGPVPEEARWLVRLMVALGSDLAVSCSFALPASRVPTESDRDPSNDASQTNDLPPQFLLTSWSLFVIQNYIQAITVAAALRVLSGLAIDKKDVDEPSRLGFMDRIWSLLKMEIEAEGMNTYFPESSTKVVHLADEVVRARRLASSSGSLDVAEEARIREYVDRTLRLQDPVFILLRRRLVEAIGKQLVAQLTLLTPGRVAQVPEVMQTGRGSIERVAKHPRLHSSDQDVVLPPYGLSEGAVPSFLIKGFEDPVLVKAVGETCLKIFGCVQWISVVWGDLV